MFKKFDFSTVAFYAIACSIVLFLVAPIVFEGIYEKYIVQSIDRASLAWLQHRGLEFSEEEQHAES